MRIVEIILRVRVVAAVIGREGMQVDGVVIGIGRGLCRGREIRWRVV